MLIFSYTVQANQEIDLSFKFLDDYYGIKLSWSLNENIEIHHYELYYQENDAKTPPELIDKNIKKEATAWESGKRKNWEIFPYYNIKSPTQWGDASVLTSGIIYKIILKVVYIDSSTKKLKYLHDEIILYPFKLKKQAEKSINMSSFEKNTINKNISQFFKKSSGIYFFCYESICNKIIGKTENEFYESVYLEGGYFLHIYKEPYRPKIFGEFILVKDLMLNIVYFLLSMFIILLMPVIFNLYRIFNVVSAKEDQIDEVMISTINKKIYGAISIYLFLVIFYFFEDNKVFNFFISLSEESKIKLHKLKSDYHELSIFQWKLLRERMLVIMKNP